MKIYIKMFSKYFLLLAGLFLLDHGRSSHLIPLQMNNALPSRALARQLPGLGSHRDSCGTACADGTRLSEFLVGLESSRVHKSHVGQTLRILLLPFVLLDGTRSPSLLPLPLTAGGALCRACLPSPSRGGFLSEETWTPRI